MAQTLKNLPTTQETQVQSLGQEDKILTREESGCLNGRVRGGEGGQS